MKKRITEAVAKALQATASAHDQFIFDVILSGFALRRTPTGRVIQLAISRSAGRKVRDTVAYWPNTSIADGRELARLTIADRRAGRDPGLERRARHLAAAANRTTVAELAERWLDAHVRPKLRTAPGYERLLRRHVLPNLGRLPIAAITLNDANSLHVALKHIPRTANLAVGDILGGLLAYAVELGLRTDNPCRKLHRYPERAHERFLSEREQAIAMATTDTAALTGEITIYAAAGIKLALLTGARMGELCAAQWRDVDWNRRFIRLPTSKTGDPRTIYLNPAAIAVLRAIPRAGPYIIAGGRKGPYQNLSQSWVKVRRRAGLDDVRLHDLRHSFASAALKVGIPLAVVGALLGHKRMATTQRYAHLAADTVAAAADVVGAALEAAIVTSGAEP